MYIVIKTFQNFATYNNMSCQTYLLRLAGCSSNPIVIDSVDGNFGVSDYVNDMHCAWLIKTQTNQVGRVVKLVTCFLIIGLITTVKLG